MLKSNFNPSIHGLRGFAAFSVLIYHIWAGAVNDKFVPDFIPNFLGNVFLSFSAGVDLFFLISGYLITVSLIKQGDMGQFIKNRVIRIYPAFLPILFIIFALGPFAGYDYFNGVGLFDWAVLFLANLFFLPGIFPMPAALLVAWTLSYEAAFYIFCVLAYILYQKYPKQLTAVIITAAALICCIFYPKAVFFAIGALVYFARRQIEKSDALVLQASKLSPLYFCAFLAGAFFLTQIAEKAIAPIHPLQHAGLFMMTGIFSLLLFLSTVRGAGMIAQIMNLRVLQFLGTISYSLYLWHTPIMFATKRIAMKILEPFGTDMVFVGFALSSLAISLPVAWVSYMIFENYIPAQLKKKNAV